MMVYHNGLSMSLWQRRLAAFVLGSCMLFSFSPYDHVWLAVLAFAGLVWLIRDDDSFFIGLSFGFGWFLWVSLPLADTFYTYGDVPYPIALMVAMLIALLLGLFTALSSWLSWKVANNSIALLLVFPAMAVCTEWLRGHLFTGIPWTSIGNLLLETPAVGWIGVLGAYGAAFLPLFLACSLALLMVKQHRNMAAASMMVALGVCYFAPAPWQADGEIHRVALVQANIPQDQKWDRAFLNETMLRYQQWSQQAAAQADIIIWPEAAIPFFLSDRPGWDRWLSDNIQAWNTPLLFGGLQWLDTQHDKNKLAQSGLFLQHAETQERSFVGKHHLVPFGEYVPAWVPFLRKLIPNIANFQPAHDLGVLTYQGQSFGSLICYESIFPEEARQRVDAGADVLVVITNDAWYAQSAAAWQHLQAARMRAVETGRYVLRAANTGVSAIIQPDGTITASMPWWRQGVVTGTYRLSHVITPYQRWGDWPLAVLPVILLLIYVMRRRQA